MRASRFFVTSSTGRYPDNSFSHCMPSFGHLTGAATEVFDIFFFFLFPPLFISQAREEKKEAGHSESPKRFHIEKSGRFLGRKCECQDHTFFMKRCSPLRAVFF